MNEKNMLCIVCDKQQDIPETERRTMGIEIYFTGMLKQAVGALVLSPAYKGVEEIRLRVTCKNTQGRKNIFFRYGGRTEKAVGECCDMPPRRA